MATFYYSFVSIIKTFLFRVLPPWMFSLVKYDVEEDKKLISAIKNIVGSSPLNLELYRLATRHVSVAKKNMFGIKESNERLEYLGDAILGTVVAEYLFKKFPYKDEGFLTEIRARIVNRESLNTLAGKIGIIHIIEFDQPNLTSSNGRYLSHKSISGNTLEALVGAVYLDKGFDFCRRFILKRLIIPHFDLHKIVQVNPNHKSQVIEWAQKNNREIRFEIESIKNANQYKEFTAQLFIDDKPVCEGSGYSKKKAEQRASEKALELIKENFDAENE